MPFVRAHDHAPRRLPRRPAPSPLPSERSAADRTDDVTVTLRDADGRAEVLRLPNAALPAVRAALGEIAAGRQVVFATHRRDLTTQEAAAVLGMSRPHLVSLLERGAMPFHKVGNQRRIALAEVLRYAEARRRDRESALGELAALGQEIGVGYDR